MKIITLSNRLGSILLLLAYINVRTVKSFSGSRTDLTRDTKTNLNSAKGYDKERLFLEWFSNSRDEVFQQRKLNVVGKIPKYVQGSLVRNGPAIFGTSTKRYTHIFDGLAKLSKFEFVLEDDGIVSVKFCTRFLESLWKKLIVDYEFLPPSVSIGPTEPKQNILESIVGGLTSSILFDNTPVNVEKLPDGSFAATTDALIQQAFDLDSLASSGRVKYNGNIKGMTSGIPLLSTAHAKHRDGATYNYVLELGLKPIAHIVRTNKDMTRESIASITLDFIPYVHDLSVTENYIVLCIYPVKMPITSLINGNGLMSQLRFDEFDNSKIYCIPRNKTGHLPEDIKVFETQAFFAYHHVNAFEIHNGEIVLDILAYEDASMANGENGFLYLNNMESDFLRIQQERESSVWRFRLNANDAKSSFIYPTKLVLKDTETNSVFGLELATISPDFQGCEYQYCYGFNGFYRGDVKNGTYMEWSLVKQGVVHNTYSLWYEEYSYPSEPIFIPDPDYNDEDVGVLLSCVFESRRKENYLLVLDAVTMTEIARAYTGCHIPPQFHGKWFSR